MSILISGEDEKNLETLRRIQKNISFVQYTMHFTSKGIESTFQFDHFNVWN